MNAVTDIRVALAGLDGRPEGYFSLLSRLPLTDAEQTQEELAAILAHLAANPPPALNYMEVLETMRPALGYAQGEISRRMASRPLPPTPVEARLFRRTVSLWQATAKAYAHIVQVGGSVEVLQERMALICHRCVHYSGAALLEHYAAHRAVPAGLWADLNTYYASAEAAGVAAITVRDALGETERISSPANAFCGVLLVALASPYARTPAELALVRRWATRFGQFVMPRRLGSRSPVGAFGVDIQSDSGAMPISEIGRTPTARWLDGTLLAPELRNIRNRLKERALPASLGLGDDCTREAARRLLVQVYRPWCVAARPRRFSRRDGKGMVTLWQGLANVHDAVVGHAIAPGPRVVRGDAWRVTDHSAGGFCLQRIAQGQRLIHDELVGVMLSGADTVYLARVAWMRLEPSGSLAAGLALLPGTPAGILVRRARSSGEPPRTTHCGFLLPQLTPLGEAASLVAPRGVFMADGLLDVVQGDETRRVRMVKLLSRGTDFDRIGYAAA